VEDFAELGLCRQGFSYLCDQVLERRYSENCHPAEHLERIVEALENPDRFQLSSLGAAAGSPRNRRHQGVITGKMKKKIAAAVIAAEIGRTKKIASDP
jgi:hypothetical protein